MSGETGKAWALQTFDVDEDKVEAAVIEGLNSEFQRLVTIWGACGRPATMNMLSSTQSAFGALLEHLAGARSPTPCAEKPDKASRKE